MYEQYELDLGIPAGIGSIRNIGTPSDARKRLGEIPVSGYSLGVDYEPVARQEYLLPPRGTRGGGGSPGRRQPLLAQQALMSTGNYSLGSPDIFKTVEEGQWTPGPVSTYRQGPQRVTGRPEKGIEPLLSGSADTVVLRDPQLISGRRSQPTGNYPQSALGPRPKGEVSADEVIFSPRSGVLPADIGEILADYGRNANYRTGMPFPDRSIDPNQPDEAGFSSLDPTEGSLKKGGSNINPFGMVEMPAINAAGRWFSPQGRPLITRVDPTATVEVRTADADATFTADQIAEINLGKKVNELRGEYKTPVMSASRLNELRKQGRAAIAPGEGSEIGKVALYDLEDRLIVRGPQGDFVAPNRNYAIQEGEQVVGVRKAVPVYRTESVYKPIRKDGGQLTGERVVPAGRNDVATEVEPIYRIGNPMANDFDAIREELQPYIPGSGDVGITKRVGRGDLAVALNQGTARFYDTPAAQLAADPQLALPIPLPPAAGTARPVLVTRGGDPFIAESYGTSDAGNQVYVQRGSMEPARLYQRYRANETPIEGAYQVESAASGRRPIGAAPFLMPPAGSTTDEARIVGGIRRRGENIGPGMTFEALLNEIGKASFMSSPDIADGYDVLASLIESKAVNKGANRPVEIQDLVNSGVIRPGTREAALLQNAIQSRRPGRPVDLFADSAQGPLDTAIAQELGVRGGTSMDEIQDTVDQTAGSVVDEVRQGSWGDFGDSSPGGNRGFAVETMPAGPASQIEPFAKYAQGLVGDPIQAQYLAEAAIRGTAPRTPNTPIEPADVIANMQRMAGQTVYKGRAMAGGAGNLLEAVSPSADATAIPATFPANPSATFNPRQQAIEQGLIPGLPRGSATFAAGYTPDPIDDVAEYMKRQQRPSYRFVEPGRAASQLNLFRRR